MEHVDHDFRVSWRDSKSSAAVNWKEIQANQFAANLLMPTPFLQRDLDSLENIDDASIRLLAKRYQVSSLAMQIRLTNLGLVSSALEFTWLAVGQALNTKTTSYESSQKPTSGCNSFQIGLAS